MNRQGNRSLGAPSRASATTLCQKCLKRGHYSYECTVSAQQRPYTARPSRTQQLLNPQLVPKLSSDTPNELLRKKGVADEQLARAAEDRGRKRRRVEGDDMSTRSISTSSSTSVSTISTNLSRSQSPPRPNATAPSSKRSNARAPETASSQKHSPRPRSISRTSSESSGRRGHNSRHVEAGRRRNDSPSGVSLREHRRRTSNEDSQPRRRPSRSPSSKPGRTGQSTRTRSPILEKSSAKTNHSRLRSLSPFSKRLALTQSMNM